MLTQTFDNVPYAAERTPYHLTPEQVQFFDDNGYLILRNWIPADMLKRLQDAGDAWIQQGWAYQGAGNSANPDLEDFHFADRPSGRVMYRVNYLHNKQQVASLELLGCPQVLAVAESLCGRNFVPTYESMVFKEEKDGAQIVWHQDAVHPRNYRIFNYDLYLDRSTVDGGALRVLAKSQIQRQDFCKLAEDYGWNPPNVTVVEMEPGDVLLHDVMVAHGSPEVEGKARRRTIYYEFRAAEQILSEGPWDADWVDRRLRLLPLGLDAYRTAYPDRDQFNWQIDDTYRPDFSGDRAQELKIAHVVHTSGSWCSAGDVPAKKK
ncbi:MAG: phytanoyl-CoA dioxygenase family protein [Anaerolineae bacterium]|nr:phytanoyl-CoA dioxygenase family protein [Anaerolineae bacterium]